MSVSKRTRFEVLKRDDHTCQYCGASAPDATLHVDHVMPKSLGGSNKPDNLLTACKDCNTGKGSSNLDDAKVAALSDRAAHYALTMKHAATAMRADYEQFSDYYDVFESEWGKWSMVDAQTIPLPADNRPSIFAWWKAGFPEDALVDAINITMARNGIESGQRWRYFCGVVWNMFDDYELSINARGIEGPEIYTAHERDDYGAYAWGEGFRSGYNRALQEAGIAPDEESED